MHFSSRASELMSHLQAANILLVEWGNSLLNRLGYPLIFHGDLIFLIPDDQLYVACKIAVDLRFCLADEMLPRVCTAEYSDLSIRFYLDDLPQNSPHKTPKLNRLVLLPLSWTGIDPDDLAPISDPLIPYTVWTVPLPVACAAFVRIASRASRESRLRSRILGELVCVIGYSLFDTNYEGDFMKLIPDDEPLSEKEALEQQNAVAAIRGWTLKADHEWIRGALIDAVTGKLNYDDLPYDRAFY